MELAVALHSLTKMRAVLEMENLAFTPSAVGPPPDCAEASAIERGGPAVLDRALPSVFGLAILAGDCLAGDRRWLASKAVPGVLDVEDSPWHSRPAGSPERKPPTDATHEPGEPDVGPSA
jgi:hypothetical protein